MQIAEFSSTCCRSTPIIHCLHWLRITERIEYKILPLHNSPDYRPTFIPASSLFSLSAAPATHLVTLSRPPSSSSLQIADQSFRYASPRLWNQFPASLWQPRTYLSILDSTPVTSALSVNSPLSSSVTPSLFHSRLEAYLFHKSFPT